MQSMKSRALIITLLAVATGCGGGGGNVAGPGASSTGTTSNVPSAGTPNSVVITNNAFTPSTLSSTVGATVTWTWNTCSGGDGYGGGQTCVSHNVTFDQTATNSATQSSGTFSRTFTSAGTYTYHCSIHGSAMSGQVTVQ